MLKLNPKILIVSECFYPEEFKINDVVPKENLVGTWERVCLENSALGFSLNHCNYFGDKIMTIKEWNYIEVEYRNGQRRFIDYLLEEDKIKFFFPSKESIESFVSIENDTLIIETFEVYNEFMNRKYIADIHKTYFVRN